MFSENAAALLAPGFSPSGPPVTVRRGGPPLLFGAQVIGNLGFFAAVFVLARGLDPAGRGSVAFVIVTAMIEARVGGVGLRDATTVFAAQRPTARPVLLSNLVLSGLVL